MRNTGGIAKTQRGLAGESTFRCGIQGKHFVRSVFRVAIGGWRIFEHRDREEGASPVGKNVSKDVEIRISREQQIVPFWLPGCMKGMKKRELESLPGAR